MAQSVATVVLQYSVNQNSVNQAVAAQTKVAASMAQLSAITQAQAAALGVTNYQTYAQAQAQQAVATSFTNTSTAVKTLIRDIGDLGNDMASLPDPAMGTLPGESAGGGVAGGIRGVRQAAIALPGVGFQSPIVIGLRAAELAAEKTGASLLELGAAGGLTAVALVAVAVAFKDFTKNIEDGKKQLDGAIAAQNDYYKAVTSSTTQQVKDQVTAMQAGRPALVQQINETQGAIDSAFAQAQAQFGDAGARALDAAGKLPTDQLRTDLAKLQAQLIENDLATVRLTQGLAKGAFIINELAAALDEESDALIRNEGFRQKAEDTVSEDRQKRVKELQMEIDGYQSLYDSGLLSAEAAEKLKDKIFALKDEMDTFSAITQSAADNLADIAQRSDAVKNMFDAITAEGEAEQKLADARQAVADAASDHADKLAAIQQDEQGKEAEDRQKAAEDAEKDQADHLKKLADINKDYTRDSEEAVRDRDVDAFLKARQKRDDDTAKENDHYAEQEAELQKHLDKQLAADKAAAAKQVASENASYSKRQAQLVKALNDAQVAESRAAGLALAYQRQANDVQLNQRILANNAVYAANAQANAAGIGQAAAHGLAMVNITAYYGSAIEQTWANSLRGALAINNQIIGNLFGLPGPGSNGGLPGLSSGSFSNAVQRVVDQRIRQVFAK